MNARNADNVSSRVPNSADPLARVNNNIAASRQSSNPNLGAAREERKRAQWGPTTNPVNPSKDASPRAGQMQAQGRPPQNPSSMAAQKRPPANAMPRGNAPTNNGGVRNPSPGMRYRETPEHRQAKMDDLRMTLNSGQGQAVAD